MSTHRRGRIRFEDEGNGDAVVCIHGLGGDSNTFTPLMPALNGHRVLRIDLPGSGRSAEAGGDLSIEGFVRAVRSVMDEAGIQRAHLVGHSMGCIVCLHLAAGSPGAVRSLALFGPLAEPPERARAAIAARGEQARRDGESGMQVIADTLLQSSVAATTRDRRPSALAFVRLSLMRQDPDGYGRTCAALAQARRADLSAVRCPALLVTGDEDGVAPPTAVRELAAALPDARAEVLRGCGHWTPVEAPDECQRLLRGFLAGAASRAGGARAAFRPGSVPLGATDRPVQAR